MLNSLLLQTILQDAWLIDEAYADGIYAYVMKMVLGEQLNNNLYEKYYPVLHALNGNNVIELRTTTSGTTNAIDFSHATDGVGIIPIKGAITRYSGPCNHGVETIISWIDAAEAAPNVKCIAFDHDTPGGHAAASVLLSNRIKRISKPNFTITQGAVTASGGFMAAVASNKIYAATKVDQFGSIGAMLNLPTYIERNKDKHPDIPEFKSIHARKSPEKNLPTRKFYENGDTTLLEDMLDKHAQHFIDLVLECRPQIKSSKIDPTKGAMYFATEALEIGLIDGICTLEEAVERTMHNTHSTHHFIQTDSINMSFAEKLRGFLNNSEATTTELKDQLAAEIESKKQLEETLNTAIATNHDLAAKLHASNNRIAELETENAKVAKLEADKAALQAENDRLVALTENTPAAEATQVVVPNEKVPTPTQPATTTVESFMTATDMQLAELRKAHAAD